MLHNEEGSEANYLHGIRALILPNHTHLLLVLYPLSKHQLTPWLHQEMIPNPMKTPNSSFTLLLLLQT